MRRVQFEKSMTEVDTGTKKSGEWNITECRRALSLVVNTALLSDDHEATLLRNLAAAKRKKAAKK